MEKTIGSVENLFQFVQKNELIIRDSVKCPTCSGSKGKGQLECWPCWKR